MEVKCIFKSQSTDPASRQNGLADRCARKGCPGGVFPNQREFVLFRISVAARSPNDLCDGMDEKSALQDPMKIITEKERIDGLIVSRLHLATRLRGTHEFTHADLADIVMETFADLKAAHTHANAPMAEGIIKSAEPAIAQQQ